MFQDMSDWCMAKDYNGAECFSDGSRPLMAETELADIIISGITDRNEVEISILPYHDHTLFYEAEVATKELAVNIGEELAGFISAHDSEFLFDNNGLQEYLTNRQDITIIGMSEPESPTLSMGGM